MKPGEFILLLLLVGAVFIAGYLDRSLLLEDYHEKTEPATATQRR